MALTKIGKEGITGISNASNATAITIDASENVGIGTASPSAPLNISATYSSSTTEQFRIQDNTGGKLDFFGHANGNKAIQAYADDGSTFYDIILNPLGGDVGIGTTAPLSLLHLASNAPYITFEDKDNNQDWQIQATAWFAIRDQTANAERMRIDASGNVLVGSTASTPGYGNQTIGFSILPDGRFFSSMGATFGQINRNSDGAVLSFARSQTGVGQVSVSGSSTSYGTSSDYRLKENVDYTWDATTRLKQLKPARFNFIVDETNTLVDGFLAHEVSSIVPEAITGTKDAMTTEVLYVEGDELPDGKSVGDVKEASVPDYQGIDQSKLVPLLVKTIQELEARLTAGGL